MEKVAEMVMHEAAEEIHSSTSLENDVVETVVSVDDMAETRVYILQWCCCCHFYYYRTNFRCGSNVTLLSGCVNIEKHEHNYTNVLNKDHK